MLAVIPRQQDIENCLSFFRVVKRIECDVYPLRRPASRPKSRMNLFGFDLEKHRIEIEVVALAV